MGRTSLLAVATAFGAVALSGCGGSQKAEQQQAEQTENAVAENETTTPTTLPPTSETAGNESAQAAAPASFGICATCHSTDPGKNGIGPSLHGVVGRKAGSLAGFAYSDAMKNSRVTWDSKSLDAFIEAPQKLVPGTKMPFAGLPDAAKRAEIISYLSTLK